MGLFDGSTSLGLVASLDGSGSAIAGTFSHRLTPPQASHTYQIKAWNSAAAMATIGAGTGGTGPTLLPGLIRVTRVPM